MAGGVVKPQPRAAPPAFLTPQTWTTQQIGIQSTNTGSRNDNAMEKSATSTNSTDNVR